MVYAFCTPLDKESTCNAIRSAITAIGGKTRNISQYVFAGTWRSGRFLGVVPKKFIFYVGDGVIRVTCGAQDMDLFMMRLPLKGSHRIWNRFIESLLKLYPNQNFGLTSGDIALAEVEFLGKATQQVFVTTTKHASSLAGAIIGGELFGPLGALIGSTCGERYTETTVTTEHTDFVLARGRYTNGLLVEGEIPRDSSVYNEILVNMHHLSADAADFSASEIISDLDEQALSLEERNALKSAKDYLSCAYLDYSHKKLIRQLEYEGYSSTAAAKVVESLRVDWNAQAAAAAKSYMSSEYLSFSRKRLIEQLEHDGYTAEQAEFGARSVGY